VGPGEFGCDPIVRLETVGIDFHAHLADSFPGFASPRLSSGASVPLGSSAHRLRVDASGVVRDQNSPARHWLRSARVNAIANRHVFDAADEIRAHPLNWPSQFDSVDSLRQLPEHRLQLQAGQVRAQAIMLADAES
jgi:hypothetical protein